MRFIYSILSMVMLLAFSRESISQTVDSTTLNSSSITGNVTLTRTTIYLMKGFNNVENGGTITIPAGTLIKGDFETKGTLIVKRGGKIFATGTALNPIIFTSEKSAGSRLAGDWGGIIILGRAAINTSTGVDSAEIEGFGAGLGPIYGGQHVVNNDNSGIFRYVRLEFPGINLSGIINNEINGLTMGGVGSETVIEYVQVSYCGDDSFEWFGGTVNCKYLVAYKGLDDDWDADNGFRGRIQFCLSVRDKDIADQSSSNGFEIDNNNNTPSNTNNPRTRPFFSNMTVVGPFETVSTPVNPLFQRGAHLRRNSQPAIYNSLIMGWRVGVRFDGSGVINDANGGTVQLRTNIFSGNLTLADQTGGVVLPDPVTFVTNTNTVFAANTSVQLTNPFNIYPDPEGNRINNWIPLGGSPALSGSDFTNSNLAGFDVVPYRGAFGTNNWTAFWAQFDPKNYAIPYYKITLIPQGYYNAGVLNSSDTARVYLRQTSSPYNIVDSASSVIDSTIFSGILYFNNATDGTYYLQVRHRNHLETWSKSGGEPYKTMGINKYDFTSVASQAFGSNQVQIGSEFAIYGGDVAGGSNPGPYGYQDGTVDAADLSAIDNDAFNFVGGYVVTDVTGDSIVDAGDLSVTDNNASNFVSKVTP